MESPTKRRLVKYLALGAVSPFWLNRGWTAIYGHSDQWILLIAHASPQSCGIKSDTFTGEGSVLTAFNTRTKQTIRRACPVAKPHMVIGNPNQKTQLLVLGSRTRQAVLMDIQSGKILQSFTPSSPDRLFVGHGLYSPDGRYVYTSEMVQKGKSGEHVIGVRDGKNMKLIETRPAYGKLPHDLQLCHDKKTLVVSNYGDFTTKVSRHLNANIAYIDLKTWKLKKKVVVPEKDAYFSHLCVKNDGSFAVAMNGQTEADPGETKDTVFGDKHFPKPLLFYSPDGSTKKVFPKEIKSLMNLGFSTALNPETDVFALNYLFGSLVTFWDFKKQKILHHQSIYPHVALGVMLTDDRKHFIACSKDKLFYFDSRTYQLQKTHKFDCSLAQSLHMTPWRFDNNPIA